MHIIWPRTADVKESFEVGCIMSFTCRIAWLLMAIGDVLQGWIAGGALPCDMKKMFEDERQFAANKPKQFMAQRLCRFDGSPWSR